MYVHTYIRARLIYMQLFFMRALHWRCIMHWRKRRIVNYSVKVRIQEELFNYLNYMTGVVSSLSIIILFLCMTHIWLFRGRMNGPFSPARCKRFYWCIHCWKNSVKILFGELYRFLDISRSWFFRYFTLRTVDYSPRNEYEKIIS